MYVLNVPERFARNEEVVKFYLISREDVPLPWLLTGKSIPKRKFF